MLIKAILFLGLLAAATSVIIGCDPFPATHWSSEYFDQQITLTCPNSILSWTTQSEGLQISASIENCESTSDSTSSVQVSFRPNYEFLKPIYDLDIDPSQVYSFEYSIKWTDASTFCVVDLIKTGQNKGSLEMVDQNGFSNWALEDLSQKATNKWYSRKFLIDGSKVTASGLYLGFTCSRNVTVPNAGNQIAYVDNVTWQPIGGYERTLYNFQQNCTVCNLDAPAQLSSIYCDENTRHWTVDHSVNLTNVTWRNQVDVIGNLYADDILLVLDNFNVTGCIYPSGRLVTFTEDMTSSRVEFDIYMGPGCTIDKWDWSSLSRTATTKIYNEASGTRVHIAFPFEPCSDSNPRKYPKCDSIPHYTGADIAWFIVIPVVCFIGIVLAVVFGVRKYLHYRRLE